MKECFFDNNRANNGGAVAFISCYFSEIVILESVFINNFAYSSGGAIYALESDLLLNNTVVWNNKAAIGGGVRYLGI